MSAGPDGFPPLFFKKLASCLTKPLCILYNNIFKCEILPTVWKHALVTPVFKKGKSSLVENYRPISLTCVSCKVFESVIKSNLVKFLLDNRLLNSAQHGFISDHSTCTNLLESLNDWTINIRNGSYTRVAFIDFAKAFASVCHSKLLYKLSCLGISGSLLNIIKSFLSCRAQKVVIQGTASEYVNISSGVPQGSVLGPILFVIYINDLPDIFPKNVVSKYFADDAKLYTEIKNIDDVDTLQFSLDNLTHWASSWQLAISILKCCNMDITTGNNGGSFYENFIDGIQLENVTEIRDLGVFLDSKLTFTSHISQIVAKAKQRSFLLFRSFLTKDAKSLMQGYKSYILPILNYCSPIWSPCLLKDVDLIESVQRKFTHKVKGCESMSYVERLKKLNLQTLELRRLHTDLIFCYKILPGLITGPPENFGLHLSQRQSRGHTFKLDISHTRVNVRKNFFGCRICEPWNSLPENVVTAPSVISFKKKVKCCSFDKFLYFTS